MRAWLYRIGFFKQQRLAGRVISVGNLTVGGTGKTPLVIWLAEHFVSAGKRVAILSRGYRGTGGTSDEIELIKRRLRAEVRFGVGPCRYRTGRELEAREPVDIFILDDGYQHLRLFRDVNLLLLDSTRPLDLETLLPAGRLREPVSALGRADLVVLTRVEDGPRGAPGIDRFSEIPVFPAATHLVRFRGPGPETPEGEELPQPVFAFCGIGNPAAFFSDVARWGSRLVGTETFRDHHSYSAADLRQLEERAKQSGARSLLTTEKDFVNLGGLRCSSLPLYFAEIRLAFRDTPRFLGALDRKLAKDREGRP